MTRPFFSIIIPTLNEAEFLPRLLKNIVRQKERDFEVFVVDGGSLDETLAVAQAFTDKCQLTILHSLKRNVCAQRNMGAKNARGEYLIFFDADVQIPVNFLSQIKRFITAHPVPYLTTRVSADSRLVYDIAIVRLINLTMEIALLIERPFIGGYNFIVNRSVFHLVGGFRENIVHAEDYDLALRLYQAGYKPTILKSPFLQFSLRRFRQEGRIAVLQKNAQATLHLFTKGPITREIFSYPMGGLWYKLKRKEQIKPQTLKQIEAKIRGFLKLLLE